MDHYNSEYNILLIEDNLIDAKIVKKALLESDPSFNISVLSEGNEAIDYLLKKGKHSNVETPDLIILDLNLPNVNGDEVLTNIKSNEKTRRIPVVVLTLSDLKKDVENSYSNHANCYVTKPVDFSEFVNTIKIIKNFWLNVVKLPPNLDYI